MYDVKADYQGSYLVRAKNKGGAVESRASVVIDGNAVICPFLSVRRRRFSRRRQGQERESHAALRAEAHRCAYDQRRRERNAHCQGSR